MSYLHSLRISYNCTIYFSQILFPFLPLTLSEFPSKFHPEHHYAEKQLSLAHFQ